MKNKVSLEEYFDLLLTGTDEEIKNTEVNDNEKISTNQFMILVEFISKIGVTWDELCDAIKIMRC